MLDQHKKGTVPKCGGKVEKVAEKRRKRPTESRLGGQKGKIVQIEARRTAVPFLCDKVL